MKTIHMRVDEETYEKAKKMKGGMPWGEFFKRLIEEVQGTPSSPLPVKELGELSTKVSRLEERIWELEAKLTTLDDRLKKMSAKLTELELRGRPSERPGEAGKSKQGRSATGKQIKYLVWLVRAYCKLRGKSVAEEIADIKESFGVKRLEEIPVDVMSSIISQYEEAVNKVLVHFTYDSKSGMYSCNECGDMFATERDAVEHWLAVPVK